MLTLPSFWSHQLEIYHPLHTPDNRVPFNLAKGPSLWMSIKFRSFRDHLTSIGKWTEKARDVRPTILSMTLLDAINALVLVDEDLQVARYHPL